MIPPCRPSGTATGEYQNANAKIRPACRKDTIKRDGTLETVKAGQLRTTIFLSELRVLRDTPQVFECKVKGYRQTSSYKPDVAAGEVVFEHDVVLRKVPRSERAPYGILVEDFRESVFKRGGTAN